MRYVTEEYGAVTLRDFYKRWEGGTNEQTAMVEAINASGHGPMVSTFAEFDSNFQSWMLQNAPSGTVPEDMHGFGNTSSSFKLMVNQVLDMHIGSNKDQTVEVKTYNTTAGALDYIAFANVRDQADAQRTIETADNVLNMLARGRAALGAMSNRIQHAMNFIGTYGEQMQSSESRIRDTDMASEMIDFTKSQVTVQAANAMLAQANLLPQNVLALLG